MNRFKYNAGQLSLAKVDSIEDLRMSIQCILGVTELLGGLQ